MNELDALTVHGESPVGWDAATPVNETVDADGNINPRDRGFGVGDPLAPSERVFDHPEVRALRDFLRNNNGLPGLEIVGPDETERAARIFSRDGFVVVRDLLGAEQLAAAREGCTRVLRDILKVSGPGARKYTTESSRLPHRYSYGTSSCSRHMMHDPAWTSLIDLETATPILKAIFGTDDYLVAGGGGDLCLPGAVEYQHLHSDGRDAQELDEARLAAAIRTGVKVPAGKLLGELDLPTQRIVMDRTPPLVTINFAMSALTWGNGPIRQIPGTHTVQASPPGPGEEPQWMKTSTLVGALAGAGVFRDNRCWHGATPNLSREVRALPNVEYLPTWNQNGHLRKTMPYAIWKTLSPHAQKICRYIVEDEGVWPAGAGVMHPLASVRTAEFEKGPRPIE
jgi:ectoine hydroxylase-related dioxygenase (phytanoyl-CoA dioxygenase family)